MNNAILEEGFVVNCLPPWLKNWPNLVLKNDFFWAFMTPRKGQNFMEKILGTGQVLLCCQLLIALTGLASWPCKTASSLELKIATEQWFSLVVAPLLFHPPSFCFQIGIPNVRSVQEGRSKRHRQARTW